MGDRLREELEIFKEITIKLINALNKESYDELNILFQDRQKVIDVIENLTYSKQEFIQLCEDSKITQLQEELEKRMNHKQVALKLEIDKFSHSKTANKSYNNKFAVDSIYFSKKL